MEHMLPCNERQLTYKEYALMKANKSYDIYEVKRNDSKNKYLEIVNRFLPAKTIIRKLCW